MISDRIFENGQSSRDFDSQPSWHSSRETGKKQTLVKVMAVLSVSMKYQDKIRRMYLKK